MNLKDWGNLPHEFWKEAAVKDALRILGLEIFCVSRPVQSSQPLREQAAGRPFQ